MLIHAQHLPANDNELDVDYPQESEKDRQVEKLDGVVEGLEVGTGHERVIGEASEYEEVSQEVTVMRTPILHGRPDHIADLFLTLLVIRTDIVGQHTGGTQGG
jgi:hypothetical protein